MNRCPFCGERIKSRGDVWIDFDCETQENIMHKLYQRSDQCFGNEINILTNILSKILPVLKEVEEIQKGTACHVYNRAMAVSIKAQTILPQLIEILDK